VENINEAWQDIKQNNNMVRGVIQDKSVFDLWRMVWAFEKTSVECY